MKAVGNIQRPMMYTYIRTSKWEISRKKNVLRLSGKKQPFEGSSGELSKTQHYTHCSEENISRLQSETRPAFGAPKNCVIVARTKPSMEKPSTLAGLETAERRPGTYP